MTRFGVSEFSHFRMSVFKEVPFSRVEYFKFHFEPIKRAGRRLFKLII